MLPFTRVPFRVPVFVPHANWQCMEVLLEGRPCAQVLLKPRHGYGVLGKHTSKVFSGHESPPNVAVHQSFGPGTRQNFHTRSWQCVAFSQQPSWSLQAVRSLWLEHLNGWHKGSPKVSPKMLFEAQIPDLPGGWRPGLLRVQISKPRSTQQTKQHFSAGRKCQTLRVFQDHLTAKLEA